jgi:hypothetical protein
MPDIQLVTTEAIARGLAPMMETLRQVADGEREMPDELYKSLAFPFRYGSRVVNLGPRGFQIEHWTEEEIREHIMKTVSLFRTRTRP